MSPGLPAGVRWSVEVRREGEVVLARDPDLMLRTASVAKVLLLAEVAARIEAGELDPAAPLDRRRVEPVGDSGLWQHLATDVLPVADAALLVGSVSDNLATNALLDLVGLDAVQARGRALVGDGAVLHDRVRDHRGPDDPPTLSEGSAAAWVSLLERLWRRELVGPGVSGRLLGWLAHGTDHSMVAGALGLDPLSHGAAGGSGPGGVRLWHKTGTDDGVRADVGIVETPAATWTYAVIAGWDGGDALVAPVLAAMRNLGETVTR